MQHEQEYAYPMDLTANDFDERSSVKPTTYQNMIQYVAERHLKNVGLDTAPMAAKGLGWVLVGMTIQVQRPPRVDDALVGKTWHSETRGPYFRREFAFFDDAEQPVFCGASFSVLLDLEKRIILRRFPLPEGLGKGNGRFVLEDAQPSFREADSYDLWERRPVYNSYLDMLGHVNNVRYSEFAFDALTLEEKQRSLRRIALHFHHELRPGDAFRVYKGREGDVLYVKGVREEDQKKSFDVALTFDPMA